jgi:thioredoxin-like negative regulator of GroEL
MAPPRSPGGNRRGDPRPDRGRRSGAPSSGGAGGRSGGRSQGAGGRGTPPRRGGAPGRGEAGERSGRSRSADGGSRRGGESRTARPEYGAGARGEGRSGPGATARRSGAGRPGTEGRSSRGAEGGRGGRRDRPEGQDRARRSGGRADQGSSSRGAGGRSGDRGRRPEDEGRSRRPPAPPGRSDNRRGGGRADNLPGPRGWGGLARRGADRALEGGASDAWRAVEREARGGDSGDDDAPWEPEEWIDEGELRDEAAGAVGRSRSPLRRRAGAGSGAGPADVGRRSRGGGDAPGSGGADRRGTPAGDDLRNAVGANRIARFEARLKDASDAFRRERYEEARRLLRPLAEQAPGASSVRELYGLTLYRLGRWAQAKRELEAFRTQTGSTEQHPVLADCARALGQYSEVEELWEELRAASPSGALVAEGRIVAAGALADQGRLDEAIALLEGGSRPTKKLMLHHLRVSYALADLYERAGDLPKARDLFGRVAATDPDFVDIQARLRALR